MALLLSVLLATGLLASGPASAADKARGGKKKGAAPAATPGRKHAPEINLKGAEETVEASSAASGSAPPPSRGPTRIDFDDRLIQGQTNKSGAVYLYDRKELKTRSMVKKRETFREEIVGSVYDGQ
jgi:hypothetical protein